MVLLLETKPQGDNAEVCYQPLKPRHGRGVCVSECVSCFISAQRCKGAWPYHGVSASSPPALEIVNTNTHTHTHTRTNQIRGNAPKQFNTSVSGSLWKRGVPVSVWWPGQTADIDELLDANVIVPPLTCVVPWCCDLHRKSSESGSGDWAISRLLLKITTGLLAIIHTPCC